MVKYRKKSNVFEAIQWFKNGDHPDDGNETFTSGEYVNERCEGKVVRYFRHPLVKGDHLCPDCKIKMNDHGWIDTPYDKDGYIVCPGDFIVKEINSELGIAYYSYNRKDFLDIFEPIE